MDRPLPYGTQWIDDDDIQAVVAVLRSGHLTQGPVVEEFEHALAAKVGAKHCVVFCNATAALQCAVKALGTRQGAQGITSPITFVASANCMALNGIEPRFADIDPRTYNISPERMEESITPRTALLLPVHYAGQPCDMDAISRIATNRGLPVIEDAAHAIGSRYADGSPVGCCAHSDMTVFSFHPVKTMTTGEGGAVTTNDPELHRRLALFRSHGITRDSDQIISAPPGPWWYEQQELSGNYRITDIQCALGLSQLRKLDLFKRERRRIVSAYNAAFRDLKNVRTPWEHPGVDSCHHLYPAQIDFEAAGKPRAQVMAELATMGVGTQVHYIPVHLQPWYRSNLGGAPGDHPVAESFYEKELSIPLFPKMTDSDVQRVAAAVSQVCG